MAYYHTLLGVAALALGTFLVLLPAIAMLSHAAAVVGPVS